MATRAARRMDPERRREHLIDVASAYVGAHGTAISLDDVAKEAGISPPLMRHYFKNRDGLLAVLTERATSELEEIFLDRSPLDLGKRLERYLQWVGEHEWGHWLWVASAGHNPVPDFSSTRHKLMAATVGVPWDEQDAAVRVRANAWVATIEATVTEWLDAGRPDLDQTVNALLDVAVRLDVVGAKPAARAWKKQSTQSR